MIVDSLTHVTPDGRWFNTTIDASEHELLRQLDHSKVQRAIVVALAGHIENDFVRDVCRRHPDRLVACASFNPAACKSLTDVRSELRAQLAGEEYKALKLHPRLNRYDPLDPYCLEALDAMTSFNNPLPVWLDTLFYFRGGKLRRPLVDTIHELVGRFPSLKFVLLHGGGTWILQVAEAIRDCPNAFLDLSFTMTRYKSSSIGADLRFILENFDQRVIFGSDFPEVSIENALAAFRDLAGALSPGKCTNILGRNLMGKILGLEAA
jgi:predicted TIM-barrel fold metal-dependent hydrolase